MRNKLIDAIYELSQNEIAEFTTQDFLALAKESEEQLLDRLIHIAKWYADEYNNQD
jgi:hypothetical protein